MNSTYPDHGGECNIRSDDSVSICGLSQSYVSSNNLVKELLRFSPRSDWDYIRQRKQNITHNNNEQENAKRIPHTYQIGDKIMLKKQPAQVGWS